MAENKKSFILYCDLIHTVSKMPDDKAGELFKHILKYVNDENPETDDLIIQLTFEPIKQQLKRDLTAWENERSSRSLAGKKGMEARWGKRDNDVINVITTDNSVMPTITSITDNVTVTVNDTVTVNEKENKFEAFWNLYNIKTDRKKCFDKWMKLKMSEIEKILATVEAFKNYKPFPSYRHPNPLTYLNGARWNDEIPTIKIPETKKLVTTQNPELNKW